MSSCPIQIYQGATYTQIYRWGVEPWLYKSVTAVPSLTPLTFTITSHAIPDGWSVAVAEFAGLESIQAADWPPTSKDFYAAQVINSNTIAFNTVDGARVDSSDTTPTTGTLAIMTPVSLSGVTAVFNIYPFPSPGSGAPLSDPSSPPDPLLTVNPTVDDTAKTITLTLADTDTADLDAGQYAYALIVTAGSVVTVLDEGAIMVVIPGVTSAASNL